MKINYRKAAEKKIGRKLKKHEQVHHIDGDHKNNKESNLMVCSSKQAHRNCHLVMQKNQKLYETVMKGISVVMLIMLALPIVLAEEVDIEKSFNIKIEDNVLYITAEGMEDYEKTLHITNNSIDEFQTSVDLDWEENVTCGTEQLFVDLKKSLENKMQNLTSCVGDMNTKIDDNMKYYPLYANCVANLTLASNYMEKNKGYKEDFEGCDSALSLKELTVKDYESKLQASEERYDELDETNKDCTGQRGILLFLMIGLGIAVAILGWKLSPYSKKGNESHEGTGRGRELEG